MTGPCAKTRVFCLIVGKSGAGYMGENQCDNPQEQCPRGPGEGYEKCISVCQQQGHAEMVALRQAGEDANGGQAYLYGHTYVCQKCQEALFGAGVINFQVMQK